MMSGLRKTKKNISSNPSNAPKITKNKLKDRKQQTQSNSGKKTVDLSSSLQNDLIESLLSKGKIGSVSSTNNNYRNKNIATESVSADSNNYRNKNIATVSSNSKGRQSLKNKLDSVKQKQHRSKKDKIIYNFHHAINSTNSDQVIVKMLELNETDILNFYANLEKMIGKELSGQIRQEMSKDIRDNQKTSGSSTAICPFCQENKSNCVILLCGHLICHKCGKNINRCKYPCPKCKKPIKYIQYIVD